MRTALAGILMTTAAACGAVADVAPVAEPSGWGAPGLAVAYVPPHGRWAIVEAGGAARLVGAAEVPPLGAWAVDPAGRAIAAVTDDGVVVIDPETGATTPVPGAPAAQVAFAGDGAWVVLDAGRAVRLADGLAVSGDDLLAPLDARAILRRVADDVVVEELPGGPRTTIATCPGAQVLAAHPPARAALLACAQDGAWSIEWAAPGAHRVIAGAVAEPRVDDLGGRWRAAPGAIVDLADGTTTPLPPSTRAVAASDTALALVESDRAVVVDRRTGARHALDVDPAARAHAVPGVVAWDAALVDLDAGRVHRLPGPALALRADGAALVAAPDLHWIRF